MSDSKGLGLSISITPLNYADIPACASITADAFSTDPHTIVKQLGSKPFDMYKVSIDGFLSTLHRRNCVYVKAVDNSTGEIVGHAGWGFRGVEESKIPWAGPTDSQPLEKDAKHELREREIEARGSGENEGDEVVKAESWDTSGIDRLHALEDTDMQHMMAVLMPEGTSCMYILGLIISPSHQSLGVGSALIQHGAAIADKLGLFTWVHSSNQAWRAYSKFGFEVVSTLDVDLDQYAPRSPRMGECVMRDNGGKEGGNWGRYVIRHMKRMPQI
ncbi:acyl-CoA N-acyltransferase [Massarina eburnea CBS 473.64]|uniref:Acyl-CoA N-acyltransferase n=1 Tax=Massarina eburnea CBS 473.64 TaxID=1395130 RepID=A0A6A6SH16_9PLEO|nr:acyl-CoA N-acyltransferase [Massarina eburnea CBS 473.64]